MRASGNFDFLDMLAVIGFVIGVKNYMENVNQTEMQDTVNDAVSRIEKHLKSQDEHLQKQDELIELLKGALNEKDTETSGLHP